MTSYNSDSITAASDSAKFVIYFANNVGELLTNLKLQKLLYYAQGWHLAHNNRLLFSDEIEAWVHGPVVPTIYHVYKKGWQSINYDVKAPDFSLEAKKWLISFLKVYLPIDAFELEKMTHLEEPWLEARGGIPEDEICSNRINPETMKKYFLGLLDG